MDLLTREFFITQRSDYARRHTGLAFLLSEFRKIFYDDSIERQTVRRMVRQAQKEEMIPSKEKRKEQER